MNDFNPDPEDSFSRKVPVCASSNNGAGGVPAGGVLGDIIVKNSGTDGDAGWQPQSPADTVLTDAGTVTWTVNPKLGDQKATVTLGGNRGLSISGAVAGMSGRLTVIQDGTGGRTLSLPAGSRVANGGAGAVALTATAAAVDKLVWEYDGTHFDWVQLPNFT